MKVELFWNLANASDENIFSLLSQYYKPDEIESKLLKAGAGQYFHGQENPILFDNKNSNDWVLVSRIVSCNSEEIELQDAEGDSILVHGANAETIGVKCTANLEMDFDLSSADEDELKMALSDCAVIELRIPVSDLLDHGCTEEEIDECIVNDGFVDVLLENWDSLTVSCTAD